MQLTVWLEAAAENGETVLVATLVAKNRRAGVVLIPLLDILQSVSVLGYLSITVTLFLLLFPHRVLGAELASIFAIFTSKAWNMAFSFFQTLRTVPHDLDEASRAFRFSSWQRFWRLEFPFAVPGLVWNMMISTSGGWFFVVASEAITGRGSPPRQAGWRNRQVFARSAPSPPGSRSTAPNAAMPRPIISMFLRELVRVPPVCRLARSLHARLCANTSGTQRRQLRDRGRTAASDHTDCLARTRSILFGDRWLPRHDSLSLLIGEPIMPASTDFTAAVRLRYEVRAAVVVCRGEPDVADL